MEARDLIPLDVELFDFTKQRKESDLLEANCDLLTEQLLLLHIKSLQETALRTATREETTVVSLTFAEVMLSRLFGEKRTSGPTGYLQVRLLTPDGNSALPEAKQYCTATGDLLSNSYYKTSPIEVPYNPDTKGCVLAIDVITSAEIVIGRAKCLLEPPINKWVGVEDANGNSTGATIRLIAEVKTPPVLERQSAECLDRLEELFDKVATLKVCRDVGLPPLNFAAYSTIIPEIERRMRNDLQNIGGHPTQPTMMNVSPALEVLQADLNKSQHRIIELERANAQLKGEINRHVRENKIIREENETHRKFMTPSTSVERRPLVPATEVAAPSSSQPATTAAIITTAGVPVEPAPKAPAPSVMRLFIGEARNLQLPSYRAVTQCFVVASVDGVSQETLKLNKAARMAWNQVLRFPLVSAAGQTVQLALFEETGPDRAELMGEAMVTLNANEPTWVNMINAQNDAIAELSVEAIIEAAVAEMGIVAKPDGTAEMGLELQSAHQQHTIETLTRELEAALQELHAKDNEILALRESGDSVINVNYRGTKIEELMATLNAKNQVIQELQSTLSKLDAEPEKTAARAIQLLSQQLDERETVIQQLKAGLSPTGMASLIVDQSNVITTLLSQLHKSVGQMVRANADLEGIMNTMRHWKTLPGEMLLPSGMSWNEFYETRFASRLPTMIPPGPPALALFESSVIPAGGVPVTQPQVVVVGDQANVADSQYTRDYVKRAVLNLLNDFETCKRATARALSIMHTGDIGAAEREYAALPSAIDQSQLMMSGDDLNEQLCVLADAVDLVGQKLRETCESLLKGTTYGAAAKAGDLGLLQELDRAQDELSVLRKHVAQMEGAGGKVRGGSRGLRVNVVDGRGFPTELSSLPRSITLRTLTGEPKTFDVRSGVWDASAVFPLPGDSQKIRVEVRDGNEVVGKAMVQVGLNEQDVWVPVTYKGEEAGQVRLVTQIVPGEVRSTGVDATSGEFDLLLNRLEKLADLFGSNIRVTSGPSGSNKVDYARRLVDGIAECAARVLLEGARPEGLVNKDDLVFLMRSRAGLIRKIWDALQCSKSCYGLIQKHGTEFVENRGRKMEVGAYKFAVDDLNNMHGSIHELQSTLAWVVGNYFTELEKLSLGTSPELYPADTTSKPLPGLIDSMDIIRARQLGINTSAPSQPPRSRSPLRPTTTNGSGAADWDPNFRRKLQQAHLTVLESQGYRADDKNPDSRFVIPSDL